MNLHRKQLSPLLLCGLGICFLTGCTETTWYEFQQAWDRSTLETSTPAFNPGYFKDTSLRHVAIFFDILDGQLVLNPRPAELRPGSLPYQSRSTGDVRIVYFDSSGQELGNYALENPLIARSCDFTGKLPMGESKPLPRGAVEVLVPHNIAIAHVKVGLLNENGKRFQVGEVIKARRDPSHPAR